MPRKIKIKLLKNWENLGFIKSFEKAGRLKDSIKTIKSNSGVIL